MFFSPLVSLLPFLASAQAYFILSHPVLSTTRLDPIVQPGGVSAHVHSIVGGSNFDKTMSYESARQSTCTTAGVTEDKSNYWTPQMYYYNPKDQTYQAITVAGVNTYYLPRYGKDGKVQAFPDGLRMVSGSPFRRTFNNDADSKAITFVCLDYSGSHQGDPEWAERNSFFNHNCPNGMRAQVFFRSCWDGVNLDSADHLSHMAWPSGGVDGGECPASHPVRLVSLFYEFIYNTQNFPFNDPQYPTWVLANGDTTGYGFHGDFLNGWPSYNNGTNILQQAIDGCNANNGVGGELQNCPPFVPYLNGGAANACRPQNLLVDENVGFSSPLSKLPGDNPIWIGNGTKPSYANYTETVTNFTDFKSVIPTGYTETGCIAEGTSGRALNALYWSSANMTRGACVAYCQSNGFPLAGVQYGQECRCDTAIRNGGSNTTLLDQSRCNFKCAGNNNENCGGSAVMNLFNNPAMYKTKPLPAGWTYSGCYTEISNGRSLSGYSFASQSMTQELCINTCASKGYAYAGAEWSQECYCSNSIKAGANLVDDGQCSNYCKGDITTTCGGSSRLSVFTFNNVTVSATSSANTTLATSTVVNATSAAQTSVVASPTANSTSVAASSTLNTTSISPTSAVVSTSTVNTTSTAVSSVASANATSTAVSSSASNSTTPAVLLANSTSAAVSSTAVSSAPASSAVVASPSVVVANSSSAAASSSPTVASPKMAVVNTSTVVSSSASASPIASSSASPAASSSTTSSTIASSSAAASASPSPAAPLPSGWTANGCMTEPSGVRALVGYSSNWAQMTPQACISACQARGYKYAGVEYGRECYCGDAFSAGSNPAPDSNCNMKCGGDSTLTCGGASRLTTFVSSIARPPVELPSGWQSTGCYSEPVMGRALKADSIASDQMTIQTCIQAAQSRGYAYAGLEYGKECWMSNSIDSGAVKVEDTKCSTSCSGDIDTRCGGAKLLSIYNTSIAPPSAVSSSAPASSVAVSPSPSPVVSSTSASASATGAKVKRGSKRSRR